MTSLAQIGCVAVMCIAGVGAYGANTTDPTQTDFYKHATGQDDDAIRQQQAERMKRESFDDYVHEFQRIPRELDPRNAIDTKTVLKDWKANPARATIKYDVPNVYKGVLSKVAVYDNAAKLIIDADTANEVVVTLYRLQGFWTVIGGKLDLQDVVPQMRFAANYDPGQSFYFFCPKAMPLFGKLHLLECMAFETKTIDQIR